MSEHEPRCVVCKVGHMRLGETTVTFDRDDFTVVIRHVPAEVCDNCGDAQVSDEVAEQLHLEPGETCAPHRHRNEYLMLHPEAAVGRCTSRSHVERVEPGFVAFATVGSQGLPPHQITNLVGFVEPTAVEMIVTNTPTTTARRGSPTRNH